MAICDPMSAARRSGIAGSQKAPHRVLRKNPPSEFPSNVAVLKQTKRRYRAFAYCALRPALGCRNGRDNIFQRLMETIKIVQDT
jgi:hypothetical protein